MDRARPLLEELGATLVHVGDAPGDGDAAKTINNMLSATNLAAAAEALAMGIRAGLDPERLVDCVNGGTGASHAMREKVGGQVLTGRFGSRFTLGQYLKDLGIARGLADDHDVPTPVNGAAHAVWAEHAAARARRRGPHAARRAPARRRGHRACERTDQRQREDLTVAATAAAHDDKAERAIRGAFFGFFVDMFDIYLPVVVLTPAIKYFVSPDLSDSATSLVTGAIFAATLVGRPVGALIFGHFADRIGRKKTTLVSVSGFGVLTVVIGCLPGYATWGIASVVCSSPCGSSSASSSAASTPPRARWPWSTRPRSAAARTARGSWSASRSRSSRSRA